MLSSAIAWVRGWATTLHIMFFERETYRYLRSELEDYAAADRGSFDACYLTAAAGYPPRGRAYGRVHLDGAGRAWCWSYHDDVWLIRPTPDSVWYSADPDHVFDTHAPEPEPAERDGCYE